MIPVDWGKIKVVIFDVDGTLYTQSRMRKKMLFSLLSHYLIRPWKLQDLKVLRDFRIERENRSGGDYSNLEETQFEWCAAKGGYPVSKVKEVVDHWMFKFPNKYLPGCIYPGVKSFFDALRKKGIAIAIYSDYKAVDKLEAMGLSADLIVSSTDAHIDRLKPDPKAVHYIAGHLNVKTSECLFIGDRAELDGQCAIKAGSPYLIVEKKPYNAFDFYAKLEADLTSQAADRETVSEDNLAV